MHDPATPATHTGAPGRRVCLIFWEGYLGVAPSLFTAIKVFVREGHEVHVVTRLAEPEYPDTGELPGCVEVEACLPVSRRIARLGVPGNLPDLEDRRRLEPATNPVLRTLRRAWQGLLLAADFVQFLAFARRRCARQRPTAVVGVDPLGLVVADLARSKGSLLLYWSLELFFLDRLRHPVLRLLKRAERTCSRCARLTVVQDARRAESLVAENRLDPRHIAIVPNAPLGPGPAQRGRLFHERFGLPPSSRVVLHLGMIGDEVLSRELATAASRWRDGTHLVFHERVRRSPEEPLLKELVALGGGNVHLSLEPVPLDQLDGVVASADAGVALYRADLGPNFALMASASGKLAYYLRCGLPVVCLDLPGMREIAEGFDCGICVDVPERIGDALETIWARYDELSRNAVRCYLERYEASRFFPPILAALGQGEE